MWRNPTLIQQQCLKSRFKITPPTHILSQIIFTCRTCLASANEQHYKICLCSVVQRKLHPSWTEVGIIPLQWERAACAKIASQEITGVLENSQAWLSSCALRGNVSCWEATAGTGTTLIWAGFPLTGRAASAWWIPTLQVTVIALNCIKYMLIAPGISIYLFWFTDSIGWCLSHFFPVATAASQVWSLSVREQF